MPHEFSICSDPGWLPGMQVAFKFYLKGDEDPKQLGLMAMHVMEQVRAKQELIEAIHDEMMALEKVERHQELIEGTTQRRLEGRATLIADFEQMDKIRHIRNPRRGEWVPSAPQQQEIATYDVETRKLLRAIDNEKQIAEATLPTMPAKIARCRAILDGLDRAESMKLKVVAEAAD